MSAAPQGPVTIMGNAKGATCATCGRKIKQGQRLRATSDGRFKAHAYAADCGATDADR